MSTSLLSDERRSRLRKKQLVLILALSFIFNLAFAIAGFRSVVGLYALLVYVLLLAALSFAVSFAGLDQYSFQESMLESDPARVRIPLNIEFAPYVAAWLIWWLVTELFHDDVTVYADSLIWQFFLFPAIVLTVTWQRAAPNASRAPILLLLYATLITLFFPTASWAPQHTNALLISLRVVLYFFGIFLFDYLKPPQTHHSLEIIEEKTAQRRETVRKSQQALESGFHPTRDHILLVFHAFESVAIENDRAHEIAILNAWILVSPLIVGIVGLFGAAILYTMGRSLGGAPLNRDKEFADETTAPAALLPPNQRRGTHREAVPAPESRHIATSEAFYTDSSRRQRTEQKAREPTPQPSAPEQPRRQRTSPAQPPHARSQPVVPAVIERPMNFVFQSDDDEQE
jgi:hypothetical protein